MRERAGGPFEPSCDRPIEVVVRRVDGQVFSTCRPCAKELIGRGLARKLYRV